MKKMLDRQLNDRTLLFSPPMRSDPKKIPPVEFVENKSPAGVTI